MKKERKYRRTCILLAGGTGRRMDSDIPKQYINVMGRTIIGRTLYAVSRWKSMDSLVIVADKDYEAPINILLPGSVNLREIEFLGYAAPGGNRQLSILNALRFISDRMADDAVVMIHDSVRPEVSSDLIRRCDEMIGVGDGVMPYLDVTDTTYISADKSNSKTTSFSISDNIDRDTLIAGQTPEFYDYHKYLSACEALSHSETMKIHGSTEVAVRAGMDIRLVLGEESNFKITTRDDLNRLKKVIEERLISYEGVGASSGK